MAVDESQIGRRLKEAREASGKTQAAVAKEVGIDSVTLSRYERGVLPVPRATLLALSQVYNRPVEELGGTPLYVGDVPRGTARVAEPPAAIDQAGAELPRALRLRANEVERELIELGATDEQVRDFHRSVRESPVLMALFRGGAPNRLSNEELLQLFDGVAIGFKAIIEQMVREAREEKRRR